MQTMKIGHSDLEVSKIALGTWAIGGGSWWGTNDDNESIKTIRTALDKGINLVDTAPVYGFGHSEEVVGKAIKPVRDQVVLSTKCGLMFDRTVGSYYFSRDGFDVYKNLTKQAIIDSVDQSLKRLGTNYIDILFTHWQSVEPFIVPIEETMEALMALKKAGKIRAIGGSNMSAWHIEEYVRYGELDIIQEKYSLIDRRIEKEILPAAEKYGVTFQAYSPLEQGLLTGKIRKDYVPELGSSRDGKKWYKQENLSKIVDGVDSWLPLCDKYGCTLGNLAIAWVAAQSNNMNVLCGARKLEQIEENALAGNITLETEDVAFMRDSICL
ncbi:aldo/keto reductase [Cellulosilyticum lentocellum]|uniref:NADP-dependent oxidoreductase domain n=1 Tax=Cellulosilyticum lentocellum (strain ATCC 49066 / DSM 5427 / NCIMB 11756 / RHM5) TaxID=642492 RepID=F2JJY3_CELLD|nr:aldo/keto reductase [Cellulosilyticum lentocellum]ADZ83265.1 NADP-dependent oxidoreductase domain [Cellulosilyticum lentocellum DSM 5427]